MTPAKVIPINRIFLLVHPLFSNPNIERTDEDRRRVASYLLRKWRNEMVAAANDPHALVIFLKSNLTFAREENRESALERIAKLEEFAQKRLGERFVPYHVTVRYKDVAADLRKRGIKLSNKWQGKAFGEYLDICVREESQKLAEQLKVKPSRFKLHYGSSVEGAREAQQLADNLRRRPRKVYR